jgi:hypothetical protein
MKLLIKRGDLQINNGLISNDSGIAVEATYDEQQLQINALTPISITFVSKPNIDGSDLIRILQI